MPKQILKNIHNICRRDWGEWSPSWPRTNSCSTSPSSRACARLGLLHFPCFFSLIYKKQNITFQYWFLTKYQHFPTPCKHLHIRKNRNQRKEKKLSVGPVSKSSQNDPHPLGHRQDIKFVPFLTISPLLSFITTIPRPWWSNNIGY